MSIEAHPSFSLLPPRAGQHQHPFEEGEGAQPIAGWRVAAAAVWSHRGGRGRGRHSSSRAASGASAGQDEQSQLDPILRRGGASFLKGAFLFHVSLAPFCFGKQKHLLSCSPSRRKKCPWKTTQNQFYPRSSSRRFHSARPFQMEFDRARVSRRRRERRALRLHPWCRRKHVCARLVAREFFPAINWRKKGVYERGRKPVNRSFVRSFLLRLRQRVSRSLSSTEKRMVARACKREKEEFDRSV